MSYSPTASHHEEDGANSPLMNGNGNPNGDAEHGKPAEEEEEIDLIR